MFIAPSYESFSSIVPSLISTALFIFLGWIYVRWVAATAEKAGRSYVAFMLLAIFVPFIAWIVVIMFKKPEQSNPAKEQ